MAGAVPQTAVCSVIRARCPHPIGPRHGAGREHSPIAGHGTSTEASSKQHCLRNRAGTTEGGGRNDGERARERERMHKKRGRLREKGRGMEKEV